MICISEALAEYKYIPKNLFLDQVLGGYFVVGVGIFEHTRFVDI